MLYITLKFPPCHVVNFSCLTAVAKILYQDIEVVHGCENKLYIGGLNRTFTIQLLSDIALEEGGVL